MRKIIIAAMLLAASVGSVKAREDKGVRTYGVGLQSCEWWTAHIEDRDKNVGTYMIWCRANPTRGVEEAAGALVLSLKGKAAQQ